MLQLRTFGGLSIEVNGVPATGAAGQRRTLALLALLAAAGKSGLSRDKLIAYLWPESDAEHGRSLLKQACYALRRDLHTPELFLGGTELRLNADVVSSDVQTFEDALERRDAAQAIALYTGPFLDGFYLSESVEFERWVEAKRERLKQRAGEALETLAADAAARGDQKAAVNWWRWRAVLEPLNSRVAVGLMTALAAGGDRAGALQYARIHDALLRDDLDAVPEAAVVELTARLREESAPATSPVPPVPQALAPREVEHDHENVSGDAPFLFSGPLQPVRRSAMRAHLSHQRAVQAPRRHRRPERRRVHRLPRLHGRVSVRSALHRSEHAYRREVQLLREPRREPPAAGVRQRLSDRMPHLRRSG